MMDSFFCSALSLLPPLLPLSRAACRRPGVSPSGQQARTSLRVPAANGCSAFTLLELGVTSDTTEPLARETELPPCGLTHQ